MDFAMFHGLFIFFQHYTSAQLNMRKGVYSNILKLKTEVSLFQFARARAKTEQFLVPVTVSVTPATWERPVMVR